MGYLRRPRLRALVIVTVAIAGLAAPLAVGSPASAADDGYLYRVGDGGAVCTPTSISLGAASPVDANYPASITATNEFGDGVGGFGAPTDVSSSLNPAGNVGTEGFYGAGIGIVPPGTMVIRVTLLLGGTPTYQQVVQVNCPNAVVGPNVAGVFSVVSEDLFPTADPPTTGPPTPAGPVPVVAQSTTTG